MTLREYWNKCIFKRDANLCQKCLDEGRITFAHDAHHIIHKVAGLFLRYLMDNGVALCRSCHDLDAKGELLGWCKEWLRGRGIDYYGMKREGHVSVSQNSFDEERARLELTKYMEEK